MANVDKRKRNGKDRIKRAIEDEIKKHPVEVDGQTWAAKSQKAWSAQVGVSVTTFGRVIKNPPFVRRHVQIDGTNMTLLRLGEEVMTARVYARAMSRIWRRKTGRVVTWHEFGCLCGLADVWPEGEGPKLLTMVLDRWPEFMAGAKVGDDSDRYYRYPSIRVIRRFHDVALEMALMDLQAKGSK